MKLSSVVVLAAGALLALAVRADQTFTSDTVRGDPLIPTAAKVFKTMAGIQFCPTGDCVKGPFVTLTPSRFEEVTTSGTSVLQALDLNEDDSVDWSNWTPATTNNVLVSSSTSFQAVVYKVDGDASKMAKLKLTATVYYKDATVSSAGQTLTVPKGALKFTAEITNWPFAADTNVLELEMTVSGQRAPLIEGVTPTDLSIPKIADKTGDVNTKIVTFDSGMFLDVPLGVTMDGANKKLSVKVPTGSSKIVWTFSKFTTKAVYDPVLRYVEPVTVVPCDSAKRSDGKALVATAARFKKGMATIQFCPIGDCKVGPFVELMPSRFEEVTPAGDSVLQALNLNEDDSVRWTDMVPVTQSGSLVSSSTSFEAVVYKVDGDASKTSKLKLTATLYYKNTTLTSAGQTFTVPVGALKFTAEITNWPFAANNNVLVLEIQASGLRTTVDTDMTRSMRAPRIGTVSSDGKSKIVAFDSGIFMDVPLGVVLDGVITTLNVGVGSSPVNIKWTFPKFATKATYDPVIRYVEPATTVTFQSAKAADGKTPLIRTVANFIKDDARIQFCPTGDCVKGPFVPLMATRFEERKPIGDGKYEFVAGSMDINEDDSIQWSQLVPAIKDGSPVSKQYDDIRIHLVSR